jgi:type IV secretory pathway VirB3-like protein
MATEVMVVVPKWMNEEGIEETESLMEIFCEALALHRPEGIAGVPVSFAMTNMIIGTLSAAFDNINDNTAKANVLIVASSVLELMSDEVKRMKALIPKDLVRLVGETGGNA